MRRTLTLVAAVAALLLLAVPAQAQDDLDCDDFASQAEAQATYEQDRSDPHDLDRDDDGEACEDFDYGGAVQAPSRIDTGAGGTARDDVTPLVGGALTGALVAGLVVARRRRAPR
jgi:hypothetical protein